MQKINSTVKAKGLDRSPSTQPYEFCFSPMFCPCFAPWITAVADQMDLVVCCVAFCMAKTRPDSQEHSMWAKTWLNKPTTFQKTPYHSCASMLSTHDIYRQFSKIYTRWDGERLLCLPLHDQTWPTTTCAYIFKPHFPTFGIGITRFSTHVLPCLFLWITAKMAQVCCWNFVA